MPPVAKPRAPYRSERKPEIGPATRKPTVCGSIRIPALSGVAAKLTPCRGSQIPWSQMMSMNISPPRAIEDRKFASTPNVYGRMRKRSRWNIGSFTRVSIRTNATRSTTPSARAESTNGLLHPIGESP